MAVAYTPWPDEIATLYRKKGYWRDEPLTQIITRHLDTSAPATAIICRGRTFTYDDLNRLSGRLAAALEKQGLHEGDTALVRMPNCAEFYLVFFALLKCGVVALNALHSHGLFELRSYVRQIRPRLVVLSCGDIDAQGACVETDGSILPAALENEGVERSRILLHAMRSCTADACLDGFTWATSEGFSVPENEQPIEAADAKGIAFSSFPEAAPAPQN
ncbi:MAG: AMP-binding protein [Defluviicoccus sp.]|nr:MAG: AMP-binding protein [Defluviicoccus sp.]